MRPFVRKLPTEADLVERIEVEGDPHLVVHTNTVLMRADSPDDAYTKASELGRASEISYDNPDGKRVNITYCGLRDLNVIHGELKHGGELTYSEEVGIDDAAIGQLISSREDLGVFAPIRPSAGPNYISKDIVDELHQQFPDLNVDEFGDSQISPNIHRVHLPR